MLFGRLPEIKKANIPEAARLRFEQIGPGALSQVVVITTATVDGPIDSPAHPYEIRREDIPLAVDWLTEQRSVEERRKAREEKVEAWILLLVAVEAADTIWKAIAAMAKTVGHWFGYSS